VLLVHGLGGTKLSFLPAMLRLASSHRAIAVDLPGFGDSYKPLDAPYHPPFFARALIELMDALGIAQAHVVGNSMGGRIALDLGLRHPERVGRLALLSPSLAWRCDRTWAPLIRLLAPQLALLHAMPRWLVEGMVDRLVPRGTPGWMKSGIDEFVRTYRTPRGRVAFWAAARQIYLEEPWGERGFWTRLATLQPPALFVWGRRDALVPIGFMPHVQRALPSARHLELDCGHVAHLERPRQTYEVLAAFFASGQPVSRRGGVREAQVRRPLSLIRARRPAHG
jgi:pimeloyl-ACP methyl ester carboxylesterase